VNRVLTPANQTPLVSKSARVSISTEQSEKTLKCLETDTFKMGALSAIDSGFVSAILVL
jgi:hypothetical protein